MLFYLSMLLLVSVFLLIFLVVVFVCYVIELFKFNSVVVFVCNCVAMNEMKVAFDIKRNNYI